MIHRRPCSKNLLAALSLAGIRAALNYVAWHSLRSYPPSRAKISSHGGAWLTKVPFCRTWSSSATVDRNEAGATKGQKYNLRDSAAGSSTLSLARELTFAGCFSVFPILLSIFPFVFLFCFIRFFFLLWYTHWRSYNSSLKVYSTR